MTPWRSWAVAWRNQAHHCPPCLANVRSSHCEAESRTQIFDQNPQSQSLPFPVVSPSPRLPLCLELGVCSHGKRAQHPFPPFCSHSRDEGGLRSLNLMQVLQDRYQFCCPVPRFLPGNWRREKNVSASAQLGDLQELSAWRLQDLNWSGSSAMRGLVLYPLQRGILFQTSSVRSGIHVPQSFPRFRLVQI